MEDTYRLIGAASGWGAQLRECAQGPLALEQYGLLQKLRAQGFPVSSHWKMLLSSRSLEEGPLSLSQSLSLVHEFNLRLARLVEQTLAAREFPIVIGGDHSIAVGTWNGVYMAVKKERSLPLGLIWIDSHMDAHTIETTPSGAWHGMPLAALLGHGVARMSRLIQEKAVLCPEAVCLVGASSFEEGEAALLERLRVRVFFAEEVRKRGLGTVLQEAIAHVARKAKVFGISLDLDVMRPEEAPGVGSPVSDGLAASDLLSAISVLKGEERLVGFELVEFNPQRDREEKTAQICLEILAQLMRRSGAQAIRTSA